MANKVVGQVMAPAGQAPTAVQKRLFGETARGRESPQSGAASGAALARDAYRRPPTEKELDVLVGIFDWAKKTSWITWRRWG